MGTIVRTNEGSWLVQARRKDKYRPQTFRLKTHADEWVVEMERLIDFGGEPSSRRLRKPRSLADLIDIHVADLHEVGKPLRRSKRSNVRHLWYGDFANLPGLTCAP